jgi:SAM-dependent methyltransferase
MTIRSVLKRFFSREPSKYDPEAFFRGRYIKYGFDLRSVGNCTLSHEENKKQYEQAGQTLLDLLGREKVELQSARILDVGCGTGFYTPLFQERGVQEYTGVDFIDDRFDMLRNRFPHYRFEKFDVTRELPDGLYDVILMIDVTQHIVSDRKFSDAMNNVQSHLALNGVFVVTSWLTEKIVKRTYYEVARPMCCYREKFLGWRFSEPVPFRDKFVFTIRPPSVTDPTAAEIASTI